MSGQKPKWLIAAPFMFLALWSGGFPVAKVGLQYSEPMTLLAMRYAMVIAIMAVFFVIIRPPLPKTRMEWVHLAIVGLLIQSLYFSMCYVAFRAGVAAGTVALLLSLQPILVALVAPRWAGEKVGIKRWGGLVLGLAGVAIVIVARMNIEAPSFIGFSGAFLGLLAITSGSLWEKRFGLSHHPVTANLIGYTAGFIGVLPFMLSLETMQVDWTWQLAVVLFYLVVGNSVIAIGLLLAMIRAGDVSSVSALFFLVPPFAALLAWFVLGEIMPPIAWAGMAVAATGVLLATRT